MFRLFLSHLQAIQSTDPRLTMFIVHSGIQECTLNIVNLGPVL